MEKLSAGWVGCVRVMNKEDKMIIINGWRLGKLMNLPRLLAMEKEESCVCVRRPMRVCFRRLTLTLPMFESSRLNRILGELD